MGAGSSQWLRQAAIAILLLTAYAQLDTLQVQMGDSLADGTLQPQGLNRGLLASIDELIDTLGAAGHDEVKPDEGGDDKKRFFEVDPATAVNTHKARIQARRNREAKHRADRSRTDKKLKKLKMAQNSSATVEQRLQPEVKVDDESVDVEAQTGHSEDLDVQQPLGESAEADSAQPADAKPKQPKASVRKRGPRRKDGQNVPHNVPQEASTEDCKIFILDLAPLAEQAGIPACDVANISAHPLTLRLMPNPVAADPAAEGELSSPPATLEWTFPYHHWPHQHSQHAAPWYLKNAVLGSSLYTTNISEASVVLVDDYCYLIKAISDQLAQGHWWLDTHKHYKSDGMAGEQLLELYHQMAHERTFMHKQGRNYLFVTPLTSFNFGNWKTMEDYVGMSCEHFSNSMHIVFDQAQRWRCGRYRPDRTLVAPLSSTEYADVPPEDAERELTVVFRGTCVPDGGKDPQYAGKRLRALVVKYLSKGGGHDIAASCTREDKVGEGPSALNVHFTQPHQGFMKEMGNSKFCILIPGDTQNTPRLTEAFLAGCVPVFIGPPWHAMPYPEVVDYKAAAVSIHFADTSKWANFGSKWVLEKNTPRDTSRMHPRWWTPQVSGKDMDELGSLQDLPEFLRNYPEELYQQKKAAVYKVRQFFLWEAEQQDPPAAADVALKKVCGWGEEERKIVHMDI